MWNIVDGPFKENNGTFWHCICDCGTEKLVRDYDLKSGKSTQCRICSTSQLRRTNRDRPYAKIPKQHRKRLAAAARNAIDRCTRETHSRYVDWGGRGISVYQDWIDDLILFIEFLATLEGYDDPHLVLDRIDNDQNYVPGNLRFVDRSTSQSNQRGNGGEHAYNMNHGFVKLFKRLHDNGISFKNIGQLYMVQESTVRNCVRELEA